MHQLLVPPQESLHDRSKYPQIMRQHARFVTLRSELAGWRQARSGPAGPEPKFYQNLLLDRNQTTEFAVSSCTRYTDFQKIYFLKNYISRFFLAKICLGPTQNMPWSSPNDPQNIPKSTKNRSMMIVFATWTYPGSFKPCFD